MEEPEDVKRAREAKVKARLQQIRERRAREEYDAMTRPGGRSYSHLGKKGTLNKGMFDFTREIDSFRASTANSM